MPSIDPIPLPYGPLQYYQVQYILQIESNENDKFLARCKPVTKGHFSKRVVDIRWTGVDGFTEVLQEDTNLTEMLRKVMLKEGEIRIDPQEDYIRIYGKWIHEESFAFNPIMFEIADRMALPIRKMMYSDIK